MTTLASRSSVQAATPSSSILKLYIDSTTLPLVQQAADFVAGLGQPGIMSIITWLRLPLSDAQLRGANACYIPQTAAVTPAFIGAVCEVVRKSGVSRVEIHSNQHHAWRGVAPLLRELLPLLPERSDSIRLELYDDGTRGLIERDELKRLSDPDGVLRRAAQNLRDAILDGKPLRWGIPQSYAWQHVFPTRYHLLRPDLMLVDGTDNGWHESLSPYVAPMQFDQIGQLDSPARRRYFELFGLDVGQRERLKRLAECPDALLFTGSSVWDKTDNAELADRQISAIQGMHANGLLQKYQPLAFKAHPANLDHSERLASALGERIEIVPPRVPIEVLLMADLLPRKVAGIGSSSYFTLPKGSVDYLLCRPEPDRTETEAGFISLMLRAGLVDSTRLIPLF